MIIENMLILLSIIAIIVLLVISASTLVVALKIYKMHDVRNEDGEYAWMVPSKFISLQERLNESQERMVATIAESSKNQQEVGRLLENLVHITSSLSHQVNGQGHAEKK